MSLIPGTLPSDSCFGTPQEVLNLFAQYLDIPAFAVSSKVLYSDSSPLPSTDFIWVDTTGAQNNVLKIYNTIASTYQEYPLAGSAGSPNTLIDGKSTIPAPLTSADKTLVSVSGVLYRATLAELSVGILSSSSVASRVAKAWVNFNGTGVVAIRDDFNVSTIADNGTGDYTINFSTPMSNANYAFATHGFDGTLDALMNSWGVGPSFAQTTTSIRLQCTNDFSSSGYVSDLATACVTIFGS